MPLTVPMIDQTAMGVQPLAAPSVTPMRNAAPEQLQQSGQAMQQAGALAVKTGQSMTDALNTQVDVAAVRRAETAALSQANVINYDPSTGFLNQRGQNAVDQYEPARQAVTKGFQDQLDRLTPIQREIFRPTVEHHLLNINQQMMQHNFAQTTQMSAEAALSTSNIKAENAGLAYKSFGQTDGFRNPAGDFEANLSAAEQATLTAVKIMKGVPSDSAVAREALLNLHTQVGTTVLTQMLDDRSPAAKVQSVYDDLKAQGMLTLRAQDTLGKMVKGYTEQEGTRSVVNQNLSDAQRRSQGQLTSSTGTPDYESVAGGSTITTRPYDPEKGTVTINTPNGSSIQAPADGTVLAMGDDGEGSVAMQIQHADGSVTSLYGLNASNVKAGDKVQRGEDLGPGGGTVLWSLADKNGNAVDPTKAGLGPVDLSKITDEKVLSNALASMRKQVTDPYLQQQATSEMESIVRHNQQMQNAQATQSYKQASAAFYGPDGKMQWRNIPRTLFNQLSPEQQQGFKDLQNQEILKNYNQGQAFKEMSEAAILYKFAQEPGTLTPAAVDEVRPKLANSTAVTLMNRAQALHADRNGVIEAQGVNDRIKHFAGPAGVNVNPETDAEKQTMTDLTYRVNNAIDQIKSQNKGKATSQQVDDAIKQLLIQTRVGFLPHSANNPMVFLNMEPNVEPKKFNFQMPYGATQTAPGSDGKMHYLDSTGKIDLGEVK